MEEPVQTQKGSPDAPSGTAEQARAKLSGMVAARAKEREKAAAAILSFSETVDVLRAELAASRAREAAAAAKVETLKRGHALFLQNHRRLYQGFVSLLKSVEETCGHGMALEQRIEAALLSSEIGNALGEPADISTERARAFLAATSNCQPKEIGNSHA